MLLKRHTVRTPTKLQSINLRTGGTKWVGDGWGTRLHRHLGVQTQSKLSIEFDTRYIFRCMRCGTLIALEMFSFKTLRCCSASILCSNHCHLLYAFIYFSWKSCNTVWTSLTSYNRSAQSLCSFNTAQCNALLLKDLGSVTGIKRLTNSVFPFCAAICNIWLSFALGSDTGIRSFAHAICPWITAVRNGKLFLDLASLTGIKIFTHSTCPFLAAQNNGKLSFSFGSLIKISRATSSIFPSFAARVRRIVFLEIFSRFIVFEFETSGRLVVGRHCTTYYWFCHSHQTFDVQFCHCNIIFAFQIVQITPFATQYIACHCAVQINKKYVLYLFFSCVWSVCKIFYRLV